RIGQPAAQVPNNRIAVDGVAHSAPHAAVRQYRVPHVEAEIGEVEAGGAGDTEISTLLELMHHVRQHVFDHHARVCGGAAEVPIEAAEHHLVVNGVAHELIRPGAHRMGGHRVASTVG